MVVEEEKAICDGAVAREGVREADAMLRRHWRKVYGDSDMGEWHNLRQRLRTPRSRASGRESRDVVIGELDSDGRCGGGVRSEQQGRPAGW